MTTESQPFNLTEEQHAIVGCRSEALRVIAFAGTGKTATLRAYAKARPDRRILYLAFNRAVAQEAQATFPGNVACLTIHALAYRSVGWQYRHKLRASLRANQAAAALGLSTTSAKDLALAGRALQALQHYLSSASGDLASFAAGHPGLYHPDVILAAERLWELMRATADARIPMLHDGYLKLYQLSRPRLPWDLILLDEAQDTNPVTLEILRDQTCARVFVGDPHQQIYQFRHACNAMADPSLQDQLVLSQSFRFGAEIAAAANRLLGVKREPLSVVGVRTTPAAPTHAFIARGNAALYRQAVHLARTNQPVYWCGGVAGYRLEQLLDLWRLRAGDRQQVQDSFIRAFKTFGDLASYCESTNLRDLQSWIQLIERRPDPELIPQEVAHLLRTAARQPAPGVCALATVHKAKGLEWGAVELAEDFPAHHLLAPGWFSLGAEPDGTPNEPVAAPPACVQHHGVVVLHAEELHLRYVAVTRAQGECRTPQWGEPLFGDLAGFCRAHPGFVLVGSHAELLPPQVAPIGQTPPPHEPVQLGEVAPPEEVAPPAFPELSQVAPTVEPTIVPSSAVVTAIVTNGHAAGPVVPLTTTPPVVLPLATSPPPTAPVNQPEQGGSGGAPGTPSEGTCQWFLGAIEPEHLVVLTNHYSRRYPGFRWEWLLGELSALRVVNGNPSSAVAALLNQHQLGSALALVERFLADLGLVVVEPAACQQQVGNGESPVVQQIGVGAADAGTGSQVTGIPAHLSVRHRVVKLFKRVAR